MSRLIDQAMRASVILEFFHSGRFVLLRQAYEDNSKFNFFLFDTTQQRYFPQPSPASFNESEQNREVYSNVLASKIGSDEK